VVSNRVCGKRTPKMSVRTAARWPRPTSARAAPTNSAKNSAPPGCSEDWQKRRNSPPPDHSLNMRLDERLCGPRCEQ
jgi:hypothetical protein